MVTSPRYIAYKLMSQSSISWAIFSIKLYTNNNSSCLLFGLVVNEYQILNFWKTSLPVSVKDTLSFSIANSSQNFLEQEFINLLCGSLWTMSLKIVAQFSLSQLQAVTKLSLQAFYLDKNIFPVRDQSNNWISLNL